MSHLGHVVDQAHGLDFVPLTAANERRRHHIAGVLSTRQCSDAEEGCEATDERRDKGCRAAHACLRHNHTASIVCRGATIATPCQCSDYRATQCVRRRPVRAATAAAARSVKRPTHRDGTGCARAASPESQRSRAARATPAVEARHTTTRCMHSGQRKCSRQAKCLTHCHATPCHPGNG